MSPTANYRKESFYRQNGTTNRDQFKNQTWSNGE